MPVACVMIVRPFRLTTSTGRRQRPRDLIGQAAGASARPAAGHGLRYPGDRGPVRAKSPAGPERPDDAAHGFVLSRRWAASGTSMWWLPLRDNRAPTGRGSAD